MLWNWRKMNFTTIDDIKKNKLTFSHLRTWKKELLLSIDNTKFLYDNEYPKMIALIAIRDRSKEDHKKLDDYRDDLVKREKIYDDKFEDAQISFSKKHDLKLIHPKM